MSFKRGSTVFHRGGAPGQTLPRRSKDGGIFLKSSFDKPVPLWQVSCLTIIIGHRHSRLKQFLKHVSKFCTCQKWLRQFVHCPLTTLKQTVSIKIRILQVNCLMRYFPSMERMSDTGEISLSDTYHKEITHCCVFLQMGKVFQIFEPLVLGVYFTRPRVMLWKTRYQTSLSPPPPPPPPPPRYRLWWSGEVWWV